MSFGAMAAPKADYALPTPPGDGVSDITFSPNGTLLTAGSWDNGVRSSTKFDGMLSGCPKQQATSSRLRASTELTIFKNCLGVLLLWWEVVV